MKKIILTILLLVIPCLLFAQETVRTWKSKSGKTLIEAAWDSEKDSEPETVFFLKDGKRYKYPLEKLSDADRKYVTDGRARKAQRGSDGEDFGLEEVVDETPKPLTVGGFTLPTVRKYAVLVGVTDYSEMNNLTCCVKDVHAIREQLLKLGFKENDIYMLESGRPARELPTKKNILERLDLVLDQVKLGDMVFFAFAGHGAENASGAYICPMETEDDNLSETAVSIPLIMEKLDASKAGFKWLVVDACRNNPFRNRVSGVSSLQRIDDPPKGILLLQSCGQDEFSSEDSDQGHGLFTASFVEALSGAADQDKNGVLTLMEVCTYTTETTNRRSLELFQKYQRPYFNGDVTDFVLHEDLNRPKADALFAEAQKLFNEEKYEAAKTKISAAIKMYPEEQKYANLGGMIDRFLELIKEKAEAERKAKEAAELESRPKLPTSPAEAPSAVLEDVITWESHNERMKPVLQTFNSAMANYNEVTKTFNPDSRKAQEAEAALRATAVAPYSYCEAFLRQEKTKLETMREEGYRTDSAPYKAVENNIAKLEASCNLFSPEATIEDLLGAMDETRMPGTRRVETVNGVEFAFRWCPAGSFMMGSPESEEYRSDRETPHEVTLTQGFWMLETEVTVGMFRSFVKQTGYTSKGTVPYGWTGSMWKQDSKYSWQNPGFSQTENCPVTCVSWDDAQAFSEWLGKQVGLSCSLPTEAQWEYACRAGTTGAYAGNLDEMGWYGSNLGSETHEVGQKKPNAWGLYDMHGNVWEWCLDWYDSDYYAASPTSDPLNSKEGTSRVDRGGGWDYHARYCRSAYRSSDAPDSRISYLGFRPLLVLSCPSFGS